MKRGPLLVVQSVSAKLMMGWPSLVGSPRMFGIFQFRTFRESEQVIAERADGSVSLPTPDSSRVGEFAFPNQSQPHLFRIEGQVHTLGIAHANSPFADIRISCGGASRLRRSPGVQGVRQSIRAAFALGDPPKDTATRLRFEAPAFPAKTSFRIACPPGQ